MHLLAAGRRLPALMACGALLLGGCATTGERTESDPVEPFNRGVYRFNDALDRGVLKPTAKAYDKVTPNWFRTGVGNFFTNLKSPGTIVNQLLQGKFGDAGKDTLRFLLNTTFGWGGLIDVASMNGMPQHDEDFGQTLGKWGVPPGPYLMLPFFGPANLRDAPSKIVDNFLEPFYWYDYGNERWFALGLNIVDDRARLLPLDATLRQTYDPYGFIRDAYLQRRQYLVYDGDPPEEPLEEFEDMDDGTGETPEADAPEATEPLPTEATDGVEPRPEDTSGQ
jgi:phospholipid-binding lipoprotein MlaA